MINLSVTITVIMKTTATSNENSHLLIARGKSSRLDAIRKKSGLEPKLSALEEKQNKHVMVDGLNQMTKEALQQATALIEGEINVLMAAYPAGKKTTFFKIKHGADIDKVKNMSVQDIFKLLKLESKKIKHFQMVANLHLNGKTCDAE